MRKVLVATTGLSYIIRSLSKSSDVVIIGILDFEQEKSDCMLWATSLGIKYRKYDNNMDSLKRWLAELQPDLLVVYKMPFLLPVDIFSIPKFGSINIHPSLLPKYRGPNPWFWMYYNMDRIGGITIHTIDELEDHGDILAQVEFDINLGDELQSLQLEAEKKIYPLLLKVIQDIELIKGVPQGLIDNDVRVSNVDNYQSFINPKEMSGLQLWHLLRGFPWLLSVIIRKKDVIYEVGDFYHTTIPSKDQIGTIVVEEDYTYLCWADGKINLKKL